MCVTRYIHMICGRLLTCCDLALLARLCLHLSGLSFKLVLTLDIHDEGNSASANSHRAVAHCSFVIQHIMCVSLQDLR